MKVRFLQPHTPYAKGDIAGVSDSMGKRLIEVKVAEEVRETKPQKQQTAPKSPEKDEQTTKQVRTAQHDKQVKAAPNTK